MNDLLGYAAHYCVTKTGPVGLTRALAYKGAAHGSTVKAIAPRNCALQWAQPGVARNEAEPAADWTVRNSQEIAPTVLLLASDNGAYFIGQTLSRMAAASRREDRSGLDQIKE